jgi:hypothetical protein
MWWKADVQMLDDGMSDFDPDALRKWLVDHDVRLRPPAPASELRALQSAYQGRVSVDLMQLYEAFDGCDQGDFELDSFFSIWPIEAGLAHANERGLEHEFAFGDVDLAADVVLFSMLPSVAPVRWHGGMLPSAESLGAFFATLTSGHFWSR